ncbi:histidinol-phosphate transaminase [Candidatus Daviesbacteria bacterium]|nr:histidinol-phosphate transaminase [Candidatus Daviesbacteria bacterium]
MKLKQYIRKDVLNFEEYKTVSSVWDLARKFNRKESEITKLDQGENLFGVFPIIARELGKYEFYNYYPDPEYKDLRKEIAKSYKIPFEKIMVGSGSDELIDLIFRMVVEVSDEVINFPPTFGMYDVSLKLNRAKVVNVKRDADFNIDIKAALKAINKKTKLIIVCSPNNPTGNPTPRSGIVKLLETGKLVMLDEAYAEFASRDNLDLLNRYPNLMILRTFSKWAGIAGLRLGFVAMNEYLISQLMKIKSPFNVNLAAEVAGIAVLKDLKFARENITKLKLERSRLSKKLSSIPYLKVFPSETNFVFAQVFVSDFKDFKKYLLENRTLLRYFESDLVRKSVRITISQPKVNDKVFSLLANYQTETQKYDGIIFDMDGVLIDVTKSCRIATLKTVNYYFSKNDSKLKATRSQINKIKSIPGFNNDWDASFVLIDLLNKKINENEFDRFAKPLSAKIKKSIMYKAIRAIWQTFYLGSDEFEKSEDEKAPFINKHPLRFQEKLLVKKELLDDLVKKYGRLGIATSRPRQEAIFAIKQFALDKYFEEKYLVALEDANKEKPNPEPLIEAKKRLGLSSPVYVGDTINDCLAAKNASMPSIYVGKENLGDFQVFEINQIGKVLYEKA